VFISPEDEDQWLTDWCSLPLWFHLVLHISSSLPPFGVLFLSVFFFCLQIQWHRLADILKSNGERRSELLSCAFFLLNAVLTVRCYEHFLNLVLLTNTASCFSSRSFPCYFLSWELFVFKSSRKWLSFLLRSLNSLQVILNFITLITHIFLVGGWGSRNELRPL
jgi:hypothetical protein